MNRSVKFLLGLIAVLALALLYVFNPRLPTPAGEQSASLYQAGTLGVASQPLELIDTSRPTPANGDFEGRPARALNGAVWYPDTRDRQPFPLIVYSHGFMSSASEVDYLADFLVPKGYVVVAVNYPLSHGGAPGGPTVNDVINQPGDIAFVLDAMLERSADTGDELYGLLDASRVAAVGLSLGGLTTQLAAFHREVGDPRIAAAVSIAGPSAFLERDFFAARDIPFMMVAGSADAIIPHESNAAPLPSKADNAVLVTMDRGSHVGFAGMSSVFLRWFRHPDRLVCPLLLEGLEREAGQARPMLLSDPGLGISDAELEPCAMDSYGRAMRPADQQMLTRLALYAFLEKEFALDAERRRRMERYLAGAFTAENPAAVVQWPMDGLAE